MYARCILPHARNMLPRPPRGLLQRGKTELRECNFSGRHKAPRCPKTFRTFSALCASSRDESRSRERDREDTIEGTRRSGASGRSVRVSGENNGFLRATVKRDESLALFLNADGTDAISRARRVGADWIQGEYCGIEGKRWRPSSNSFYICYP